MSEVYPLRLDEHHAKSVSTTTLERYKLALQRYVSFLHSCRFRPKSIAELDALLVNFKQHMHLTRANLEITLASLEFFIPQCRGSLHWS